MFSRFRSCLLQLVLLASFLFAQSSAFASEWSPQSVGQGQRITIDEATLRKIGEGASRLTLPSFPISPSRTATLELKRLKSVIDRSTVIEIGGKNGTYAMEPFEVISYQGIAVGVEGSHVELSIVDGRLVGSIETPKDFKYIINPDWKSELRNTHFITSQVVIHRSRPQLPGRCEAESYDKSFRENFQAPPAIPAAVPGNLLEVSVAVDADYNFFKSTGADVNKTVAYIGTVYNFVSMIYENEVNVTYRIPYIKIWTDSLQDPYKVAGNPFVMVERVQNYWMQNNAQIQRDLVHGMTSTQWGGGGYALLQTLCSDNAYGCSAPCGWLSYPTFDYTYDVYIIAHEIGHNFGALHTHDCVWNPPLDTCGVRNDDKFNYGDACYANPMEPKPNPGSIMSYCLQINAESGVPFNKLLQMTFTPRVAAVIRAGAEAATACIQPPSGPTIVLRSPHGTEVFDPFFRTKIEWSSANVTAVDLEYSADDKKTWKSIASSLNAVDGTYEWEVPKFSTRTEIFIRAIDKNDPMVGDTSIMKIAVPYVNLQSSANTIDWSARVAGSYDTTLTLTNSGETNIVIMDVQIAGSGASAFTVNGVTFPLVIPAGQSLQTTVNFGGQTIGWYSAQLFVLHTATSLMDTIELRGQIVPTGSVESVLKGLELTLSPNPVSNVAVCELEAEEGYAGKPVALSVIDALGRTVLEPLEAKLFAGINRISFDLSAVASGSYFVTVSIDGQVLTLPLTKR